MDIVFGIISNFIPLLVIVGIIAAIVAAVRRRGGGEVEEPGIGTLRRLYYYGLSFVALMVAATGATGVTNKNGLKQGAVNRRPRKPDE